MDSARMLLKTRSNIHIMDHPNRQTEPGIINEKGAAAPHFYIAKTLCQLCKFFILQRHLAKEQKECLDVARNGLPSSPVCQTFSFVATSRSPLHGL